MRRVFIESPYSGDVARNIDYARACLRDSLQRGEAPIAPHILYTQEGVLRDDAPEERQWGISAGFTWRNAAEATVVYIDRGVSPGMIIGIRDSYSKGIPVEVRRLDSVRPTVVVAEALRALRELELNLKEKGK